MAVGVLQRAWRPDTEGALRFLSVIAFLSTTISARPAHFILSGNPSGNRIALTFDAGADRGYAAQILSLLERSKIRVSFGMTGKWAQTNPDLVRRMARDGDAFINHTYDHRSFTGTSDRLGGLTVAQRTNEINRADAIIRRLTGRSTKPYFRFPYGDYDAAAVQLVARLGYPDIVMWTVDSLGWERISTAAIVSRCQFAGPAWRDRADARGHPVQRLSRPVDAHWYLAT